MYKFEYRKPSSLEESINLFKEKEEVDPETGEVTKKKSIMQALRDSMFIKFKGMWPKLPKWMKWLASKTLPKNIIDKLEEGSGETDLFEDVDMGAARDENTKEIYYSRFFKSWKI